jgi:GT2 family glycosyltransferase
MPALSVVIPTFNNENVLRQCLNSWRSAGAGCDVEVIVVEDGCRDGTPELLSRESATPWGSKHLRWLHMDDSHELRCTNAGFAAARAPLLMAWQDDMFLQARWLVPEVLRLFGKHPEIGLMSLSRGLTHHPAEDPIQSWEDLNDWRRLRSTIGPFGWNWFRVQEVDSVIRPWIVRRACLDRVGLLDEEFVPAEWDEADFAYRIRCAGWKVATCGYERLGAYHHLGSSTLGALSDAYRGRVLKNGRLFHARWDSTIEREHRRPRESWPRPTSAPALVHTCASILRTGVRRVARR